VSDVPKRESAAKKSRRPLDARTAALQRQLETARGLANNARSLASSPAERVLAATVRSLVDIISQLAEGNRQ
jgi:hypothetical protein